MTTSTSSLAVLGYWGVNSQQDIFFQDDNNFLNKFSWNGTSWAIQNLTTIADGHNVRIPVPPAYHSALAASVDSEANPQIFFLDANDHVNLMSYTGSGWVQTDVTACTLGSAVPAGSGSALAAARAGFAALPLGFLLDTVGNLYQLENDGYWNQVNLTTTAVGTNVKVPAPADPASALAAVADENNYQNVFFLDANNHINRIAYDGSGWTQTDLTAIATGPLTAAAPGSALVALQSQTSFDSLVFFFDSNGDLYQLVGAGSQWSQQNLSATATGVNVLAPAPAVGGSALTASLDIDGNPQLFFLDANNHVNLVCQAGSGWSQTDLTALAGGLTPPAATGSALAAPAGTAFGQVLFLNVNNNLCQLQCGDSQWKQAQLHNLSWSHIGASADSAVFVGNELFITQKGALLKYGGTPSNWLSGCSWPASYSTPISGGLSFYTFDTSTGDVFESQGDLTQWTQIGKNYHALAFVGETLFAHAGVLNGAPPREIDAYVGNGQWQKAITVAPGLADWAYNNSCLVFRVLEDWNTLYIFNPSQNSQNSISCRDLGLSSIGSRLFVADATLFLLTLGNELWQYQADNQWTVVVSHVPGNAAFPVSILGNRVLASQGSPTPSAQLRMGQDAPWITLYPAYLTNLTQNQYFAAGVQSGAVMLYEFDVENAPVSAERSATRVISSDQLWIWILEVKDELFAAFGGDATVYAGSGGNAVNYQVTFYGELKRGTSYCLYCTSSMDKIVGMHLSLSDSSPLFSDALHVSRVVGWSVVQQKRYVFTFDEPLEGGTSTNPSSQTEDRIAPLVDKATIYIWDFAWEERIGHASLKLSSGTYISWWPAGKDKEQLGSLNDLSCEANQNQTYDDDVRLEDGKLPDQALTVGGLNNAAIETWWDSFRPNNTYILTAQNCSTIVFNALCAGGAWDRLSISEKAMAEGWVWWPARLAWFVEEVQQYQDVGEVTDDDRRADRAQA